MGATKHGAQINLRAKSGKGRLVNATLFLLTVLLGVLVLPSSGSAKDVPGVRVFFPSTLVSAQMQKILQSDPALSKLQFTVYPNFTEFMGQHETEQAEIIIVPSAFAKYYRGTYHPVLKFVKKKGGDFHYLLLAMSKQWTEANISDGIVGIIEEVGMDKAKDYVASLIGKSSKTIKKVTKAKDLIPLLIMENANYIMIAPDLYEKVKGEYATQGITVVKESVAVGYPVFLARENVKDPAIVDSLKKMSAATLENLGFDGVETAN